MHHRCRTRAQGLYSNIMLLRTVFPPVLLAAISAVLLPSPSRAQLPKRLERCLPYPTLADEIRETKATEAAEQAAKPEPPKVAIDAIHFENSTEVPESVQELLITAIRNHQFEDYTGWVDELDETELRGALQEHGYFRAETTTKARMVSPYSSVEHVSLSVRVDLGLQYRLGIVQFRSADPDRPLVFSAERLRELVSMHEGDIFDTSKLRQAFENLKDLYAPSGYIDFTPTPNFDIDDEQKRINLILELDQEKQYRVGRIEFLGNNPAAEGILRSRLRPGEPFDFRVLKNFYVDSKAILLPDASPEDVELRKDTKNGVVDMRFDFSTCPIQ
jgi:hypothetical protein